MRQMLLASTSQKNSRAVDHVTTAACKTNHEDGAASAVVCTHTESVIDGDNRSVPSAAQRLQAAIESGAIIVKTARALIFQYQTDQHTANVRRIR